MPYDVFLPLTDLGLVSFMSRIKRERPEEI